MFKKCCTACLALVLFFSLWISYSKPLFYDYASSYEVYGAYKSASKIELVNEKDFLFSFLRYGEGASLKVKGDESLAKEIIKNFNGEIVKSERVNEGISYYAYSKNIKYCEIIGGKKVNIHIFVQNEGGIILGSPIIYGSF